jgi:hypothetical protein
MQISDGSTSNDRGVTVVGTLHPLALVITDISSYAWGAKVIVSGTDSSFCDSACLDSFCTALRARACMVLLLAWSSQNPASSKHCRMEIFLPENSFFTAATSISCRQLSISSGLMLVDEAAAIVGAVIVQKNIKAKENEIQLLLSNPLETEGV